MILKNWRIAVIKESRNQNSQANQGSDNGLMDWRVVLIKKPRNQEYLINQGSDI